MMLTVAFMLLILLFLLPFAAGIRELRRKDDAAPLFINMDYCKDPRYFAVSFRKLLIKSLEGHSEGLHALNLSKREEVQIADRAQHNDGAVLENILYIKNDLDSEKNVTFEKEVYVQGNVRIGEGNHLQALACDGDIHILRGTRLFRWLDAEGSIRVDEECDLGVSATCGGKLDLAPKCSFIRLYGFPVATSTDSASGKDDGIAGTEDIAVFESKSTERNISHLDPYSVKNCSIITDSTLTIGEHSIIRGHVKSHKKLIIGASVTIMGNLFAEEDIEIGLESRVLGTVFSQGVITLKQGAIIGTRDRIKSVIGKKGILLENGVRVYGYIATEGKGKAL
jgi:predicted acyltransferase (DUF342 family)